MNTKPSADELRDALVGGWTLLRWTIEHKSQTTEPFGPDAQGLLVYAPEGWMSVAIQRQGRAPIPLASPASTAEQKAAAFSTYMHYAGRWRIDGHDVLHEISIAMHPGLIGSTQRRNAVLTGDELELRGDEKLDASGNVRRHRVVWSRAR